MSTEKYSGQVTIDNPIIDETQDGIYLYFHELPPVLLHPRIILDDEDDDENQTTD